MAKLACLLVLAVIAVGCGSSAGQRRPGPPTPGPGQVVYQGTEWAVVVDGGKAVALHLVGDAWRPAQRHGEDRVLGPKPGSTGNPRTPQVAAALSAGDDLVESALWVDGMELLEKGGGLTPTGHDLRRAGGAAREGPAHRGRVRAHGDARDRGRLDVLGLSPCRVGSVVHERVAVVASAA